MKKNTAPQLLDLDSPAAVERLAELLDGGGDFEAIILCGDLDRPEPAALRVPQARFALPPAWRARGRSSRPH